MKPIKQSISQGIFDMIAASFFFGTMTVFVKLASATLPVFEVVFFRGLLGSALMALMIVKEKSSFTGKEPGLLFMRGLFGFIALAMNFYAISKLNLGLAVILNYTSPIFVAAISAIFLREKVTFVLWLLTSLCFGGIYLLAAPHFSNQPLAIALGIISGFFAALAFITIHLAAPAESSYTIIFYFTVISTLGCAPLLWFGFHAPNLREWSYLGGIALTSFFAQIFLTKSMREAPASIVCPFSYLTPVISFFCGALILKDVLTGSMMLGASLVISSGVFIYILQRSLEPEQI